jgi:hypothetical protein
VRETCGGDGVIAVWLVAFDASVPAIVSAAAWLGASGTGVRGVGVVARGAMLGVHAAMALAISMVASILVSVIAVHALVASARVVSTMP